MIKIYLVSLVFIVSYQPIFSQETATAVDSTLLKQTDITDVFRKLFGKKPPVSIDLKAPRVAILPTLGYNPSMGFIIGAKATGGFQRGDPSTTNYSIFGLEFVYSSKGIITLQARHNVFRPNNTWNFQGNWQFSKYGMVDYGLGTGTGNYRSSGIIIDHLPTRNGDSAFPIQYNYIRLLEKIYRKIGAHLYAGGGLGFEFFEKIDDEKISNRFGTPHKRYSLRHDFDTTHYNANGLIFNLQYNTREHPTRSYGGIYADLSVRFNQEWMGSTKDAIILQYDFRKYWSLSKRNPEHVLAIWQWSSFTLDGEVPYLALPYTASDTYNRGGRGYTLGRFKGPNYAYFETEYRFPILRNKLLSGVCFFNMQSASDDFNIKIFEGWEPAGGAGLRVLFQKANRTVICFDYGIGKYGSSGFFIGLNEVF